jgi:hypothetical protein
MAYRACSNAVGAMYARGAGPSTPSLDQQREIRPLPRAGRRIATPPFTPVISESHQVNHRHAPSEHPRNRIRTPAFTPMLGPSGGARFAEVPLDPVKIDSVRRAKKSTPDLLACRMSAENLDIESIIHAQAMRRSADDEEISDDDDEDEYEPHFDDDDDPYDEERCYGAENSGGSDDDGGEGSDEPQPKKSKAGRKKKSEATRKEEHLAQVEKCFAGFHCKCASARDKGNDSCLETIPKADLRAIHRETYGPDTEVVKPGVECSFLTKVV